MEPFTMSLQILSLLEKFGPQVAASVAALIQRHREAKAALTMETVLADWSAQLPIINRSYEADIAAAWQRNFPSQVRSVPVNAPVAPAPVSSGPGQVVTAGALQAAVATF